MIMVCLLSLSYETLMYSISYKIFPRWANLVGIPTVPLLSGRAGPLELCYNILSGFLVLGGNRLTMPPHPQAQPGASSKVVLSLQNLASWVRFDLPRDGHVLQARPFIVFLELGLENESGPLYSGGSHWVWRLAHAPYRWRRPAYSLQLYEIFRYSSSE